MMETLLATPCPGNATRVCARSRKNGSVVVTADTRMELCMTQARKFAAGSQRWQDFLCVRKGDAAISPRKTRRTQLVAPPVAQVVTPTVTQAPDRKSTRLNSSH